MTKKRKFENSKVDYKERFNKVVQDILQEIKKVEDSVKEEAVKEEDVKGLNNRVEELTALVKLLSKTMETTNNKPVVEGWFEQG